jgi:hypothetical protein
MHLLNRGSKAAGLRNLRAIFTYLPATLPSGRDYTVSFGWETAWASKECLWY